MTLPGFHAPDPPALKLEGVGRTLANGTRLLEEATLTLPKRGLLVLVGPSGSGKSTLLRILNRMDDPTRGAVSVLGRTLQDWPVRELRRRASLVFQEGNLLGLTVRENLLLPFHYGCMAPDDTEALLAAALEEFGLESDMLSRYEEGLSVGQKQRVCLARGLIGNPELLLLDEPTAALDPPTARLVLERLMARNQKHGLTVVLSTHRMDEARMLGGRMAVMKNGRIIAEDDAETLLDNPPPGDVAEFLAQRPGKNTVSEDPASASHQEKSQ